jgi:hypothetical protein
MRPRTDRHSPFEWTPFTRRFGPSGETAESATESTDNFVLNAVTFPLRLIGHVFTSLAG